MRCLGLAFLVAAVWSGTAPAQAAPESPAPRAAMPFMACAESSAAFRPCGPYDPGKDDPAPPVKPCGYTGLVNPASGKTIQGTDEDPLAGFTRRPLDRFIIPEGGLFMDTTRGEPHYAVDYTYPDDYLRGIPLPVHPIGPGYVTTRSTCLMCYVEGDSLGRVEWRYPHYNFGFGNLVVIETPYSPEISIYSMYAHLDRDFVSLGDYVTPEDILGMAGTSGYAEEIHVHLEIRYGPPGRFWNADFSQWVTLDRWQATMFANPALLVMPENHPLFVEELANWAANRPQADQVP